jgi:uncharacterized membrane protein YgaE (UPF0421/DUF939 family)
MEGLQVTGAGAVKTIVAMIIAIFIAQISGLPGYPLAGIIAVLAAQGSSSLSASGSLRIALSAVAGALLGAAAFHIGGSNVVAIGLAAAVLIALLVWAGWTESVLISVASLVIAAGSAGGFGFWDSAWRLAALALMGAGAGLLVNLTHAPLRKERAEMSEEQSERMLRALIHFIILDLETKRITRPPIVEEQAREISEYLRKGREQHERNRKFRKMQGLHHSDVFQVLESMLGRITDIVRVLVQNPLEEEEYVFTIKLLKLIARLQERAARRRRVNMALIRRLLEQKRLQLRKDTGDAEGMYQLCTLALDYLVELEKLEMELAYQVR